MICGVILAPQICLAAIRYGAFQSTKEPNRSNHNASNAGINFVLLNQSHLYLSEMP